MILIADGGSTKSAWCLVDDQNQKEFFQTEGYNPYFVDTPTITMSLLASLPQSLEKDQITHVYYYGAGCSTPENKAIVARAMEAVFSKAVVDVGHDLLAAGRALMGLDSGFAAILGTGTNTGLYDGNDITFNIDSLGYFLGDEGSGSFLGKELCRDFMRGYMPQELSEKFSAKYGYTNEDIFDHLYNKPLPNRFLAGLSRFLSENYEHPYSREVVLKAFRTFFNNLVVQYPDYQSHSFNCVGSVGYYFRDVLEQVCQENNMKMGKIIASPIDDLVVYHTELVKLH